ncbi:MAG TPA: hypothetical protein VHM92_10500 [Allosphingosinicella sp.]|nr:hypothetical protein [Allosphingosinicella sp.]
MARPTSGTDDDEFARRARLFRRLAAGQKDRGERAALLGAALFWERKARRGDGDGGA